LAPEPRRPPRLSPGDTLAVVAPSSPVLEPSRGTRGVLRLRELGFDVAQAAHVGSDRGYLAGTDRDRAADLLWALEDPSVDAVICLRGGYGAMRTLLALVDMAGPSGLDHLAAQGPKPFIGFSDITVLHAFLQKCGWVTFYGPVVTSLGSASDYTVASFRAALMEGHGYTVGPSPDDPYTEAMVEGVAEGPLAGGCLALLASLVGTPWEPDLSGRVVFFEDVDCEPYEVDRYLTQLLAAGMLQGCAGIVVGEHAGCQPRSGGNSLGLEQVFADLLGPLGVPVLYNLPIGHGDHLATLPLGVPVRMDAGKGCLEVLDAPVV
jgi:muramoyltetrapeptide carboxypeptidase